MSDTTKIEWTDKTWNPWMGCTKVSPGCAHCYMFRDKERYGQDPSVVVRTQPKTFDSPKTWKEPSLVFTCSWSDWFHEDADAWRDEAWDIIRQTPQHTYQILTKRTDRMLDHMPDDWGDGWDNVWLGTSIEFQRWTESRVGELLEVPAVLHFLSCEPLLGPLDLAWCLGQEPWWIGWVIAGGESGPGCRPAELDWFRQLRDQCQAAGVPYFLKQLGGASAQSKRAGDEAVLDGRRWTEIPR